MWRIWNWFLEALRGLADAMTNVLFVEPSDIRPTGHIYAARKTAEEWAYGVDRCLYCGRVDPKRRRHTTPPCPRTYP